MVMRFTKSFLMILLFLFISFSPVFGQDVAMMVVGSGTGGGSDEFGYITEGGSEINISSTRVYASAMAAPTYTGTTTAISIYSSNASATADVCVGLYTDNAGTPNALVGKCQLDDVGTWELGWHDFACALSVTAATNYWIAVSENSGSIVFCYNTLTGTKRHYDTVDAYNNWNETYDSNSTSAAQFSFKVKYDY
jgi:hypothetical protein